MIHENLSSSPVRSLCLEWWPAASRYASTFKKVNLTNDFGLLYQPDLVTATCFFLGLILTFFSSKFSVVEPKAHLTNH